MPVFALLGIIISGFLFSPNLSDNYIIKDKNLVSFGAGYTVKTGAFDKDRANFFLNLIPNVTLPQNQFENKLGNFFYHNISNIKPILGFGEISSASWYTQIGLSRDWYITDRIAMNFFTGPAFIYLSDADNKIMTGFLQFKSSIEISYVITSNIRAGLSYFHMSNGGILPYGPNSGIDTLNLNLAFGI
jgi:hypothetical protein